MVIDNLMFVRFTAMAAKAMGVSCVDVLVTEATGKAGNLEGFFQVILTCLKVLPHSTSCCTAVPYSRAERL